MKPCDRVEVRVPGKIMLAGEYAVLKGGSAVSASLDAFLHVSLQTNHNHANQGLSFTVSSDHWPESIQLTSVDLNRGDALLDAVSSCLEHSNIRNGHLSVKSDLSKNFGIGSSSALRLGVVFGFDAILHNDEDLYQAPRGWDLARKGYLLQKKAQGSASGYDVATQFLGGLVVMHPAESDEMWPGSITRLTSLNENLKKNIHPYVGGKGAPTKSVMSETLSWLENDASKWPRLLESNRELVDGLMEFLVNPTDKDCRTSLCKAAASHRRFFSEAPSFPHAIADRLSQATGLDETWTFKTTGAGGEDALILIGEKASLADAHKTLSEDGWYPLPYNFSNESVRIERGSLH